MATFKLYLDTRYKSASGLFPLRLTICHRDTVSNVKLDISLSLEQWDKTHQRVVNRPDKNVLNGLLQQRLAEYQRLIMQAQMERSLHSMTAKEVRDMLEEMRNPQEQPHERTFCDVFNTFVEAHENGRTRDIYLATWKKIQKYDKNAAHLTFSDINRDWLQGFFAWLSVDSPSVNARNIHLRNIRAVFNDAIDNEITTAYPFRRFKIRPVETRKRNLTPQQLRTIFSAPISEHKQQYIDVFKLSFLLIGINIGDLLELPASALEHGRISYNRKKTHRLYSVKVEPETMEIIKRYRGEEHLLKFCDTMHYRSFADDCNKTLQEVMPSVTTYWARHSWASIASELDIPEDTISRSLGHSSTSGAMVTQTYINFNTKKIDEANRKVIDWVLYGKK